MLRWLADRIPDASRDWLKGLYRDGRLRFIERFRSYCPAELEAALRRLGLAPGDTVMLHSAFDAFAGFRGSPRDVADAFLRCIGPSGTLLMVSLPFRSSAYEYLATGPRFDAKRTASHMGLISESFRRRRGVLRSFHPTHPVLAFGARAEWIVEGHDDCLFACGPGSPFEKLASLSGKIVFFNVSLRTMTFFHYLEHLVADRLPFPLYDERTFHVPSARLDGTTATIRARVASREAVARRRPMLLFAEMSRRGMVHRGRVGNTRIQVIRSSDAVSCTLDMATRGRLCFELADVTA